MEQFKFAIKRKNDMSIIHIADRNEIKSSTTDRDTFPYPRYYRGVFQNETPQIYLRKAGYLKRSDYLYDHDSSENKLFSTYDIYPKNQFQGSALNAHRFYHSKVDLQYKPLLFPP
jgi:hypothetical protein